MNRVMGEFLPISVPTAEPFEKVITVPNAVLPEFLFLNISTLFRNYWTAFEKDTPAVTHYNLNEFESELKLIQMYSLNAGITPIFYLPRYDMFTSRLDRATIYRNENNANWVNFNTAEAKMRMFIERESSLRVFQDGYRLPTVQNQSGASAYVLTSYPSDLLMTDGYRKVELLESHSAKIKSRETWITKLTKNEKYARIPFNKLSYQVFGDRILVESQPNSIRKALVTIAEAGRWTQITTMDKIRHDIGKHNNMEERATLLKLLSNVI